MNAPHSKDLVCDRDTCMIESDGRKRSYRIESPSGYAQMTSYKIIEGIELVFNDVHMAYIAHDARPLPGLYEIHHCQEGSLECHFQNGKKMRMNQDDISIGWKGQSGYSHTTSFPQSLYKGVALAVYVPKAQKAVCELLGDPTFNLAALCNRFCKQQQFGMMLEDTSGLRQLFYNFTQAPDLHTFAYFRVKVLEILLYMRTMQDNTGVTQPLYVDKSHIEVVHAVYRDMGQYVNQKVTIAELAERYHVAQTTLKKTFKDIYGITIYQYMKQYRMHEAAKRLARSNDTVLEIASQVGYENASKFSAAFRQVLGVTPQAYRKQKKMVYI